jgi:three-Cys-motif partner protein
MEKLMSNNNFFKELSENSRVKTAIVSKYFWAWAKVIIPTAKKSSKKIGYVDLFAGPSRYEDGSNSTPLLILEQAIKDADMSEMLVALFNDKDSNNVQALETAIKALPNISNLQYKPIVKNQEVGTEIVKMFEEFESIPTLLFIDPWGYKGLSLRLINSVLKNWGCDCIFFFNYNRINMGLNNQFVREHMEALFGKERAERLGNRLKELKPLERELTIVEELAQALKEMGGKYVLPFGFKNEKGERTSHHLIFVSKHPLGYDIMKGIMAKESSSNEQGVPSFEYNKEHITKSLQPLLFEFSRPLDDLGEMLLKEFAGKTLTMREIYEKHNVGKPYIDKNYKEVLKKLELAGKITTEPSKRPKNTFGNDVKVTFPI